MTAYWANSEGPQALGGKINGHPRQQDTAAKKVHQTPHTYNIILNATQEPAKEAESICVVVQVHPAISQACPQPHSPVTGLLGGHW